VTGHQLGAARKRLGLTQQRLADTLDVHRVTVAKWETDAEPIPRAITLALEALTHRVNGRSRTRK
jgi:DNA-binding XRE family transcriptional regulator